MRNGRHILDVCNLQAGTGNRAQRRFTSSTWSLHKHTNRFHPMLHRSTGGLFSNKLSSKRGALSRPFEFQHTGRRPGNYVPDRICHSHNCVVEGCLNMNHTLGYILFLPYASYFYVQATLLTPMLNRLIISFGQVHDVVPYGYAHWYGYAVHELEALDDAESRGVRPDQSTS